MHCVLVAFAPLWQAMWVASNAGIRPWSCCAYLQSDGMLSTPMASQSGIKRSCKSSAVSQSLSITAFHKRTDGPGAAVNGSNVPLVHPKCRRIQHCIDSTENLIFWLSWRTRLATTSCHQHLLYTEYSLLPRP